MILLRILNSSFYFGSPFMLTLITITCCLAATLTGPSEPEVEVREKIVYSKVDDRELLLDAFVPQVQGQRPAVLVVHGGAWRSGNRQQLRSYATALAKRGIVCFAIDYRLAPKYKFPAQIDDCRAAVKWIRDNAADYQVDAKRLGAIGYSAGGHLVCLLATSGEQPSEKNGFVDTRLKAVVAGGAPTDFRSFPDNGRWAEYWMGGDLQTQPDLFRNASATVFVDKDDPPVFFFNGTDDSVVPVSWSKSCYEALKASGVKTEMHTIAGAGHMEAARDSVALEKAFDFLETELQAEAMK
jgi:acetyl esterase/lipase